VAEGTTIAATMGFVVFSAFNRGIIQNRQQLLLYGFALLMAILPTRLDFLQDFLGLTELAFEQWMICIVLAIAVLLVDEAIKFFMRRSR
jgi:Ca2+-transporting ATPase